MIIQADSALGWPLADRSIQCIVTSPPYWSLRDYGVRGQLGAEATPDAFVAALVAVFREARRVLRDDGTLWLNLGDCYSQSGCGGNPPAKNLLGMPWRVAFALQADGWCLRSDIIWSKPNPMPESVTDRPTRAHEYIFLLSKGPTYYYDFAAIKEAGAGDGRNDPNYATRKRIRNGDARGPDKQRGHSRKHAGFNARWDAMTHAEQGANGRNKRSVWTVATRPARDGDGAEEKHFAAFPPDLIKPCILAGCPAGGLVLDPFAGTGTTVYTACEMGRRGVGMELSAVYARVAKNNCLRSAALQMHLEGVS